VYKFDGVRGVYLNDIPELPSNSPRRPPPVQSLQDQACTKASIHPDERLAPLVGEKHVLYKGIHIRSTKVETECLEVPNQDQVLKTKARKVLHGGDITSPKLDTLEKALLAQSMKIELEAPRSTNSYVMPPLETLRAEQTVCDLPSCYFQVSALE
jgi:hypothetical protein